MLDLAAQGVALTRLVADGAEGLRKGVRAAGLAEPARDHWPTRRDLGRVRRGLEADAYRHLEAAERSQRAAASAAYRAQHGRRPQRGRPVQAPSDPARVQQTRAAADAAIRQADGTAIVLAAVREALRPVDARTGRVRRAAETAAELAAATSLLRELGGRARDAAALLEQRSAGLVRYLEPLEAALRDPQAVLAEEGLAFVAWAWQHQEALGLTEAAAVWPQAPDAARQVWAALDGAVRATGMAENLNSLLAPHRAAHRGLPPNVLAVFKVYRNYRLFPRGKRAGHSPADLLGAPSPDWLDALGYGRTAPNHARELPTPPAQTVNTLVA